jgi:hypothetical protein
MSGCPENGFSPGIIWGVSAAVEVMFPINTPAAEISRNDEAKAAN